MLVFAFVIVYVLWHIIGYFVGPLIHLAIGLVFLGIFCYAVYAIYQMLTREKQVM
jgi:hypothetical protein